MNGTKIFSAGSTLGPDVTSTKSLLYEANLEKYGVDCEIIEKELGISYVRTSPAWLKPGDLAIEACKKAIRKSPISVREIDLVIYCGIQRDYVEPATAHKIANAVGIKAPYCWDISDACHGFTAGLISVSSMIMSGQIRNALICTGERPSNKIQYIIQMFQSKSLGKKDVRDTLGAFTLGDAGGAMVVGKSEDSSGVKAIHTKCDSSLTELCYFDDWDTDGGLKDPTFAMKMGKICAKTIRLVGNMIPQTLGKLDWEFEDIDFMLPHQVGRKPFLKYLQMFKINENQSIATYENFGNLASATLPMCWDILEDSEKLKRGDNVLLVSTGSGIVVSQMGVQY